MSILRIKRFQFIRFDVRRRYRPFRFLSRGAIDYAWRFTYICFFVEFDCKHGLNKTIIFRKGGSVNFSWKSNNGILENVDFYNYLGLCLNYNGKFNIIQKKLADPSRKRLNCNIQKFEFWDPMLTLWYVCWKCHLQWKVDVLMFAGVLSGVA